jgi:hypothetical protein
LTDTAKSIPEGDYSIRLFVLSGSTVKDTVGIMLNKVSSTLPFSPYRASEIARAEIDKDNYIEVEGGGTITMVNENAETVPSEIVYQLRG